MNKKDAKSLVQAMREDGYEAHLVAHGTHRKTYSALLVPIGTFYRAGDYSIWKQALEQKKKEAAGHEHE